MSRKVKSQGGSHGMDRREAMQLGAAGVVALGAMPIVERAMGQPTCVVPPTQTQGPYWVDEMLNRSDIRSDPGSGVVQQGLPFRLAFNVSEITAGVCAPLSGAYVDVWHCNALGVYSDTAAQGTSGQRFLRGYQISDEHGNVRFLTIYPGWYQGRTVHIHFRVRRFSGTQTTFNFVSQLYFNDAITTGIFQRVAPYSGRPARGTTNANDGIYGQGGAQLLATLADNGSHAVAYYDIAVNSTPGFASAHPRLTPTDEDSIEHALDFGGGTPPLTAIV